MSILQRQAGDPRRAGQAAIAAARAKRLAASLGALLAVALLVPTIAMAAWTAPVYLSPGGGTGIYADVAVDADGDAVFTWLRYDATTCLVQARTRSAAGVLSPVQTLSDPGQCAGPNPQVAVAADGDAVFTWQCCDGTNNRIQSRARSAAGVLSPVQTLSAVGQDAIDPQLSVDADGDAVFTWLAYGATRYRVQGRARSAAGVLSPVQTLSDPGQGAFDAQVAVDADGDAVFAWADSGGIQTRRRSAAGALSMVKNLSGGGQAPQVAVDDDGDAVVTWYRYDGTNYRIHTRSRFASGTLSAEQTLSDPGQYAFVAQVAVDADGDAVFTWQVNSMPIQARARSAAGALSPVQNLSVVGRSAYDPQVAVDEDGDAVFTWVRLGSVKARERSADGTLKATQTLSDDGGSAQSPQVAVDAVGDAVVTWQTSDRTSHRIQASAGP